MDKEATAGVGGRHGSLGEGWGEEGQARASGDTNYPRMAKSIRGREAWEGAALVKEPGGGQLSALEGPAPNRGSRGGLRTGAFQKGKGRGAGVVLGAAGGGLLPPHGQMGRLQEAGASGTNSGGSFQRRRGGGYRDVASD